MLKIKILAIFSCLGYDNRKKEHFLNYPLMISKLFSQCDTIFVLGDQRPWLCWWDLKYASTYEYSFIFYKLITNTIVHCYIALRCYNRTFFVSVSVGGRGLNIFFWYSFAYMRIIWCSFTLTYTGLSKNIDLSFHYLNIHHTHRL